jgi:hypothetical protein
VTTLEPGASEVFTHGFAREALLDGLLGDEAGGDQDAEGFEVLVQEVMAAITTAPC